MRPMLLPQFSVNQSAPSGPDVTPTGTLPPVGIDVSVIVPPVVMRPILLALTSVNQSAPSRPDVMSTGKLFPVGIDVSVMTPQTSWLNVTAICALWAEPPLPAKGVTPAVNCTTLPALGIVADA